MSWKAATALYKASRSLFFSFCVDSLTPPLQLLRHQLEEDSKLLDMVEDMKTAFDFSTEANKLDDSTEKLKPTVKKLLEETAECARFVQDYARRNFVGMC